MLEAQSREPLANPPRVELTGFSPFRHCAEFLDSTPFYLNECAYGFAVTLGSDIPDLCVDMGL
jgi:hypothetical protein